jgi:hypothetical protein
MDPHAPLSGATAILGMGFFALHCAKTLQIRIRDLLFPIKLLFSAHGENSLITENYKGTFSANEFISASAEKPDSNENNLARK